MTINLKSLKIEYFEERNTRDPRYYISIGRSSIEKPNSAEVYRFSSSVVSKYNLTNYTHCKLGYNEQYQVVTFKFLKQTDQLESPLGYLKITKDKNIRKVTGVRFASKWQINDNQYAGKYPCHERSRGSTRLELAIILSEKNKPLSET